jgi:hypothetical protein
MVYKVLKTYIPAISMCFTVILLLAGIINLVTEGKTNLFIGFAFELVGYLVLTCILDELIGRINFKTYLGHFFAEAALLYPVNLFFAVNFNWIGINTSSIILCSIVYFFVMAAIHLYFYYMEKSSAEEINRLLEDWRDRNV